MEPSQRMRAWTLMDELVLEVYAMTRRPAVPAPEDLMTSLRGSAVRAAMKIVQGVNGRKEDLAVCLQSSLGALAELRYYVYLARRLGVIDIRGYRSTCGRHERCVRSVRELLAAEEKALPPNASGSDPAFWSSEGNELAGGAASKPALRKAGGPGGISSSTGGGAWPQPQRAPEEEP